MIVQDRAVCVSRPGAVSQRMVCPFWVPTVTQSSFVEVLEQTFQAERRAFDTNQDCPPKERVAG